VERGCAVPRVQHVLGGERVTVGELGRGVQVHRIGETVRGDPTVGLRRHGGGEVGNDVQLVVEPPEVVVDVLHELGVDLSIDGARVPGLGVLQDWEVQLLDRCLACVGATSSAAAARHHREHAGHAQK